MVWILASVLSLLVLAFALRPLLRAQGAAEPDAAQDVAVYRAQLRDLEADAARGVIDAEDHETARAEIARRLLAADARAQTGVGKTQGGKSGTVLIAGLAIALLAGSGGLYAWLGQPGLADQPLAERLAQAQAERDARPSQAQIEAQVAEQPVPATEDYVALVAQLRAAVEQRPNDLQGLRMLANHEARLGYFKAAYTAQARVLEILGDQAPEEDISDYAELLILAAGGFVSPEAEEALITALRLNPLSPRARYYSGLGAAQSGRPDVGYRLWIGLLQDSQPTDPWVPLIRRQLPTVAQAAGISLSDQNAPGPTAEQVQAAQDMSPEDRQAMIEGMVSGLAERLASEGGPASDWARLIRAYGVLGQTASASAIWNDAKETFAGDADALRLLREAAQAAEVAQ